MISIGNWDAFHGTAAFNFEQQFIALLRLLQRRQVEEIYVMPLIRYHEQPQQVLQDYERVLRSTWTRTFSGTIQMMAPLDFFVGLEPEIDQFGPMYRLEDFTDFVMTVRNEFIMIPLDVTERANDDNDNYEGNDDDNASNAGNDDSDRELNASVQQQLAANNNTQQNQQPNAVAGPSSQPAPTPPADNAASAGAGINQQTSQSIPALGQQTVKIPGGTATITVNSRIFSPTRNTTQNAPTSGQSANEIFQSIDSLATPPASQAQATPSAPASPALPASTQPIVQGSPRSTAPNYLSFAPNPSPRSLGIEHMDTSTAPNTPTQPQTSFASSVATTPANTTFQSPNSSAQSTLSSATDESKMEDEPSLAELKSPMKDNFDDSKNEED
ncbi:sialidase-like [Planococcus citri]|uniref:sialidase-like n=1 Tax=Planococcus citri TaxID=170843 RepID=UPI0031F99CB3